MLRWFLRGLAVVVVLAASLGIWKRDEITRLMAVNSLFEPDRIVRNFSHMDKLFLHVPLSRGDGPVSVLPAGPMAVLPEVAVQWIKDRSVTAMVILKDGQVVYDQSFLGTSDQDLRISWSLAKSFLASLYGILDAEGRMPPIETQLTDVVPALKGSAYDGATIRDVLTMSSGVAFDEDYLDFNSDINRMGRFLALGGSMDDFASGLTARAAEPGSRWHYVSIDTHVIGMVIRAATGEDIPELMSNRLFAPLGLEAAPFILSDGDGVSFVLGGLNMRTRDYARFGQMIAQGGQWQGKQIVPADWVAAMTRAQADDGSLYGYQWWIPPSPVPGEVMAQGIYGQWIYINPTRSVVIAVNSADRGFDDNGVNDASIAMLRQIAARL